LKRTLIALIILSMSLYANPLIDNLSNSRLNLLKLNKDLESQQREYNQLEAKQLAFQGKVKTSQTEYDNLTKEYRKASDPEMASIVDDNKLSEMRKNIPIKKNEFKNNSDSLNYYKSATELINIQIDITKKNIASTHEQITKYQADLFDDEILKAVWSEGYAEEFLTKDRSENECKRLVRESALRDASDKAGKSYLESFSKVKDYVLVEDNIVTQTKTRVIEEDVNSSYVVNGISYKYGAVNNIPSGETSKLFAKVKIKVQGLTETNPFRQTQNKKQTNSEIINNESKYEAETTLNSGSLTKSKYPKNSTDSYISYSEAALYSAIFPGIGQSMTGRSGIAQLYFWSTAVCLSYYFYKVSDFNSLLSDYNDEMTIFKQKYPGGIVSYYDPTESMKSLKAKQDNLSSIKSSANTALIATGCIWAINIADILLLTKDSTLKSKLQFSLNSDLGSYSISYNFYIK